MSKICPNCRYPNTDNATECFKCHGDLSEEAMREARARERREERQAQAQQRENTQRQRQEEMEQRAVFQEEAHADRENQEALLRRRYMSGNIVQRLWADDLSNNPNWTLRQLKLFMRIFDIVSCVFAGLMIIGFLAFSVITFSAKSEEENLPPMPSYPVPEQNDMSNDMPYGNNNMGGYGNGY